MMATHEPVLSVHGTHFRSARSDEEMTPGDTWDVMHTGAAAGAGVETTALGVAVAGTPVVVVVVVVASGYFSSLITTAS
jgi:hypothetical protein